MQHVSVVTSQYETSTLNSPLRGSFDLALLQVESLTIHYPVAHPEKECGEGLITQLQLPCRNGGCI